jgi:F-box interacting protein
MSFCLTLPFQNSKYCLLLDFKENAFLLIMDLAMSMQLMFILWGNNSWRMIHGDLHPPHRFDSKLLIFVNGAFNWITYADSDNHSVVSFDLVIESYRRILPPNYEGENVRYVLLGVLRDCLCFVAYGLELSNVWLMKEYGNEESWTKLYRVPNMNDSILSRYAKPLWVYEDDEVLMDCSLWAPRIKLVVYDFKNGTFKKTLTQDIKSPVTSEVCLESLISPSF